MTTKTVLVVNDDPVSLLITAVALEAAGYRVASANNGREAIERCLAETPDVIVTDVDMPELDGLGLAWELQGLVEAGRLPPIAMLATSAAMTEERRRACLAAGIRQCFGKPVRQAEFLEAIAASVVSR